MHTYLCAGCCVCRSLFEKDKLLFAFLLATRILRYHERLPPHEYEFLVTGGASLGTHSGEGHSNPDPTWISIKAWSEVCKLAKLSEAFHTLPGEGLSRHGAQVLTSWPATLWGERGRGSWYSTLSIQLRYTDDAQSMIFYGVCMSLPKHH